jgi:hypothetical protein
VAPVAARRNPLRVLARRAIRAKIRLRAAVRASIVSEIDD